MELYYEKNGVSYKLDDVSLLGGETDSTKLGNVDELLNLLYQVALYAKNFMPILHGSEKTFEGIANWNAYLVRQNATVWYIEDPFKVEIYEKKIAELKAIREAINSEMGQFKLPLKDVGKAIVSELKQGKPLIKVIREANLNGVKQGKTLKSKYSQEYFDICKDVIKTQEVDIADLEICKKVSNEIYSATQRLQTLEELLKQSKVDDGIFLSLCKSWFLYFCDDVWHACGDKYAELTQIPKVQEQYRKIFVDNNPYDVCKLKETLQAGEE